MTVTVVDVVLGTLVLGLAGWALVQTGSARPASRGCGGGCPSACGSGERSPEDEPLTTLGGPAHEPTRER
jgi:hypothetical protein